MTTSTKGEELYYVLDYLCLLSPDKMDQSEILVGSLECQYSLRDITPGFDSCFTNILLKL